jgi:hypothetical protein
MQKMDLGAPGEAMPLCIVYVLTNPAMPGLVKIGQTASDDAATRLGQLYTTGVPFPFKSQLKVTNPEEVERALHVAFAPHRLNPKREFFQIEPDQAIAILRLLHTEEVTTELTQAPNGAVTTPDVTAAEVDAGNQYARRRPVFNFDEMRIPIGSTLVYRDSDTTVVVTGPRKVRYGDDDMALSLVTKLLLGADYYVAPGPYWTFDGRSLRDIYNETYPE